MSKKAFTEAAEEFENIGADWGPLLKSLGTVLTEVWQEKNGQFLNKEERSKHKAPLAQVDQSDIQIRMGDTMLTLVPAEEGKAMVSIPVGFSDKATPATIPREWLLGTFLDGLISIFEGHTEVVWKYVENINAAIDAAAEVDEDGRMKINTKKLADHKYPVDVAEMIESMKRSYTSRSNGSAKVQASFTITKLQQVNPDPEPEPEPPVLSMEERLLQSAPAVPAAVEVAEQVLAESNSNAKPSSGEGVVEVDVNTSPVPPADVASPQLEDAAHDDPAAPSPVATPEEIEQAHENPIITDPPYPLTPEGKIETTPEPLLEVVDAVVEAMSCVDCKGAGKVLCSGCMNGSGCDECIDDDDEDVFGWVECPSCVNPHNFKKNPTDWIKHELMINPVDERAHTIEEVAEMAGCHVQTIKRALDKFEAEAAYVHMQGLDTLKNADEDTPGWVALDVDINEDWILRIECERSPTGRYARGRPILFIIMDKDFPNQADHPTAEETAEMVASVMGVEDDTPTLKATDDTDPSLSPCPDCGTLTSPNDVPKEAPDFICGNCHEVRLDEDDDWAEESAERAQLNSIYDGTATDVNNAPEVEEEIEEEPAAAPAEEAVGGLEETIPIRRLINRGA